MGYKIKRFTSELVSYFKKNNFPFSLTGNEFIELLNVKPGDYWINFYYIQNVLRRKYEKYYGGKIIKNFSLIEYCKKNNIQVIVVESRKKEKMDEFNYYYYLSVDKQRILPWLKIIKKHQKDSL